MYKLPKNIDLDFFESKELESVSIAFNSLILNFEEPVRVIINSMCVFEEPDNGISISIDNYPQWASLICKLLGKKIVKVGSDESGTLKLIFDSGELFSIHDDSERYESYVIKGGASGDIVV